MQYETIILSPHIDDAVFSLGATLAAGRFGACLVVNVYSRSRYTIYGCGEEDRITQQRHEEDRAAMTHLALHVEYCKLPDSSLRSAYPTEMSYLNPNLLTVADETWERAHSIVSGVIDKYPDSLFLAPLGLGHHIDHRIVRDICLASPIVFKVAFFEDGTYQRPSHLVNQHAKQLGLTRAWTFRNAGYDKKGEAVNYYASQLDDTVHSLLRNAYNTYGGERVWTRPNINLPDPLGGDLIETREEVRD